MEWYEMAWNGMKWNAKIEWNGKFQRWMKENLPYFHTNPILDFAHGILQKHIYWE